MKALICALFIGVSFASAMEPDREQHILEQRDRQVPVVSFEETLERYGCHGHFDINSRNHTKDSLLMLEVEPTVEEIPPDLCFHCRSLTAIWFKGESPSLEGINSDAFSSCIKLQSISIPPTVKYIGAYAFDGCTSLIAIYLPDAAQLEALGRGAFRGCTRLQGVKIPANVKKIFPYCFQHCTSLRTLTFADGSQLQELDRRAFEGCRILHPIYIPNSVHTIESLCFYNEDYRMQLFISGTSNLQRIGANILPMYSDVANVNIPAHVAHRIGMRIIDPAQINNPAFQRKASENVADAALLQLAFPALFPNPTLRLSHMYFSSFCESIEKLIVPNYVTVIAKNCFAGWMLTCVSFEEPAQVHTLENRAFLRNCMESITIPATVQTIDSRCFAECYNLENVYIAQGSQLQHIGDKAFMDYGVPHVVYTKVTVFPDLYYRIRGILEQRYPSFNIEEQLVTYLG